MANEKKSVGKLVKTTAAAQAGGVSRQTLQYYLMIGLIEPAERTSGGHQLFDEDAIKRIRLVKKISDSGKEKPR